MSLYAFPKDIDAPIPMFFWTLVEVIIALQFVGIGLIIGSLGMGLMLGIGVLILSKHLHNENAKKGSAQHMLWRLGFGLDKSMNRFPPALRMEFIE